MTEAQDELALFPLSQVLLPGGRMRLQIFEPRYLDMIKRCSREQKPFGQVWIIEGSEVLPADAAAQQAGTPKIAPMGCTAEIVDWDSLDNGLLGITIEGRRRFEWQRVWQEDSGLNMAAVDYLPEDPAVALPEYSEELQAVLRELLEHPHLQGLGLAPDMNNTGTLANVLAQILPISEAASYQLLTVDEPLSRLALLQDMLDRMREE